MTKRPYPILVTPEAAKMGIGAIDAVERSMRSAKTPLPLFSSPSIAFNGGEVFYGDADALAPLNLYEVGIDIDNRRSTINLAQFHHLLFNVRHVDAITENLFLSMMWVRDIEFRDRNKHNAEALDHHQAALLDAICASARDMGLKPSK